ncbi:MAG: hypothetical protein NVSMB18_33050 [Acetobacteraceae bacterium]
MTDWNTLSEPLQLHLADAAMRQASESLAACAEHLAEEIEVGALSDRGGSEALRLFASIIRTVHCPEHTGAMGNA